MDNVTLTPRLQVKALGEPQPCQGCRTVTTLRTLDIPVPALPARKDSPVVPAGWCPLIALCSTCWTNVIAMLQEV
jgi:hypothetical protein